MEDNKKLLGIQIKKARKNRNLTSEKLSELCNINSTYLRQIEAGTKMPSLPMFIIICQKLKVSPNYLLKDIVKEDLNQDLEDFNRLLCLASPNEMKLITSMIKCAVDVLEDINK